MNNNQNLSVATAAFGVDYVIKGVNTGDEDLDKFLFTLGCYEGEDIVVISKMSDNFVISLRNSRYNLGRDLAKAISVSK